MANAMIGIRLFAAALAGLVGCGDGTNGEVMVDQAEISRIAAREEIPGLATGIVRNGDLVWSHTYGRADVDGTRAVQSDTIFLTASVSKAVTAVAVLHAHERGLLDLDADVNAYLPFPLRHPGHPEVPITARLLLTHRSGLNQPFPEVPQFFETFPGDSAPALFPWIPDYLLPGGGEYEPRIWKSWAPGEETQYSNMGAAVLGYLVEVVSGRDFAQYVRDHVFLPLEMPTSGFRLRDTDPDRLSDLFVTTDATLPQYGVRFYPASMVRTSLSEFAHFVGAIAAGGTWKGRRILERGTVEEMLTVSDPEAGIALLWQDSGDGWRGHGGNFFGATARIDVDPASGVGIVLLANRTSSGVIAHGGEIYDLVRDAAERLR